MPAALTSQPESRTDPHADLLDDGSKIHKLPSLIIGPLPGLLCQWRCPEKHTERLPGQWREWHCLLPSLQNLVWPISDDAKETCSQTRTHLLLFWPDKRATASAAAAAAPRPKAAPTASAAPDEDPAPLLMSLALLSRLLGGSSLTEGLLSSKVC